MAFDWNGQNQIPAVFPLTNEAGDVVGCYNDGEVGPPNPNCGNLLAVLVLNPLLNNADTDVAAIISGFVISFPLKSLFIAYTNLGII